MLRDITIGQYYPSSSLVHKLDPRVKLMGVLVFMISLFITNSFSGFLTITFAIFVIIKLSKVPLKYMIKGLKAIIILLLVSVIFTMIMTPGEKIIEFFGIGVSLNGIKKGGMIAIRLIYLIMGSSLLTLTTTPNDIADGLEKAFKPLNAIKVPVHEMAMMMSIAFRFIPVLTEETDKIMKAQIARGADFESGGLVKKAKSLIPLIIPLVVSAIRRALDLATAMEARCYQGSKGRTKMKPLRYKKQDNITYLIFLCYFALILVLKIYNNKILELIF